MPLSSGKGDTGPAGIGFAGSPGLSAYQLAVEAGYVGTLEDWLASFGASEAWPVGSVFTSVVDTNPATLLGYGVWGNIGAGRVLVGLNALDADFDTLRKTGGAKTHTLTESEMPVHTHVQNAHSHTYGSITATTGSASAYEHGAIDTSSTAAENSISVNAATATNQNAGSGQAHANVQPFFTVFFWERTA
jgi:hypothetical protein